MRFPSHTAPCVHRSCFAGRCFNRGCMSQHQEIRSSTVSAQYSLLAMATEAPFNSFSDWLFFSACPLLVAPFHPDRPSRWHEDEPWCIFADSDAPIVQTGTLTQREELRRQGRLLLPRAQPFACVPLGSGDAPWKVTLPLRPTALLTRRDTWRRLDRGPLRRLPR